MQVNNFGFEFNNKMMWSREQYLSEVGRECLNGLFDLLLLDVAIDVSITDNLKVEI